MRERPTVAVFRPADERIETAVETLDSLGVAPLADPMLAIDPTGAVPRTDADYTILTSKTGVELAAAGDWQADTTLCAIGSKTAETLHTEGYTVDIVPETFSSSGLVDYLGDDVVGARVEVARSDHGSAVLTDGLEAAGAYVHETVLYRLTRPDAAGESAERAAEGTLDAALFTSSLTVEHYLAAAEDRDIRAEAVAGLNDALVGTIGDPTRDTAEEAGISVDVVPDRAEFETLARDVVALLDGD